MSILDDYNISFTNKVIGFNSDQKYNVNKLWH